MSIRHSRPRLSNRPKKNAETIPETPVSANTRPTASSPAPRTLRTVSGMKIVLIPKARLRTVTEAASPRSVWFLQK